MQKQLTKAKSHYKRIANPVEKRHHLHAYLPERIYRQLKEMHQYLFNYYSFDKLSCDNIIRQEKIKTVVAPEYNSELIYSTYGIKLQSLLNVKSYNMSLNI